MTEVILGSVNDVRSEQNDLKTRSALGRKMSELVKKNPDAGGDPEVVRHLIVLLDDKEDVVRSWAAVALGYIGSKAEAAIPALNAAYEKAKEVDGDLTSAGAIELALQRIGKGKKK